MKITLYLISILIIIGCSTPKKEETSSSDSTTVSQDSIKMSEPVAETTQPTQETSSYNSDAEGPPFDGTSQNFPELRMEPLSTDSLEMKVNEVFGEMMEVADTITYSKITANYEWERSYLARGQEGEGSMSTEREEEKKTWYFDQNYKLRAYSSEFTTGPDFPFTKSVVYLFSNDSLKAVSELQVDESEVTVTNQLRMLASNCPACGLSISEGGSAEPQVKYLKDEELASKQMEFNTSLSELIETLKSQRASAKIVEDDFVFSIKRKKEGKPEDKTKTITYPVKFVVAKQLYSNYTPIK